MEKICKNCHWFKPDKDFSHVITCLDSFEKVKDTDTCENFCEDGTYEPTGIWVGLAEVVKAVGHEVRRRDKKEDSLMAKYGVELPIAGRIYLEVEAESQEEAIEKALGIEWRDEDIVELDTYKRLVIGNVVCVPSSSASARLIKD